MFSSTKKKFGALLGALLSLSVLIYACGGGGSSSAPAASTGTTGSKAAGTSTAATTAALQVTSIGLNGGLSGKPILTKGSLGGRAKAWGAMLEAKANRKIHRALGTTQATCDTGSASTTTAYTAGTHTFSTTITATNCVQSLGQNGSLGSLTENGTLVTTEVDSDYAGSDPTTDTAWDPDSITVASDAGYTFTLKNAASVVEVLFKLTGTDAVSLTRDNTGKPTSGSLTANMSLEFQGDNGTPTDTSDDTHDIFSLTNFSDTMTFSAWDANDHPTHIVDTIATGTISIDDQINNANDVSVTFTNFTVDETVTTSNGVDTDTVTVNGQLSTACLGGAVTIATTTPIVIVGDACPTQGVVTVTDSASKVTTVTFTAAGGVHIANPDGTSQDFAKCDDAHAC